MQQTELTAALLDMGALYVQTTPAAEASAALLKVMEVRAALDDYFRLLAAAPVPVSELDTEPKPEKPPRKKPGPKPKPKPEPEKLPGLSDDELTALKKRTFDRITSGNYKTESLSSHSGLTVAEVCRAKDALPMPESAWRKLAMAVEVIDQERRIAEKKGAAK